ncbi:hypothetical protein P3T29_005087 [Kitasatospora sp. MAP5-34]|nr:hypothetical protein [Kitasatospora sp. MAP5-34]
MTSTLGETSLVQPTNPVRHARLTIRAKVPLRPFSRVDSTIASPPAHYLDHEESGAALQYRCMTAFMPKKMRILTLFTLKSAKSDKIPN